MKLGTKLLMAPVLTAAVALLSGGVNAVLMQRDAQQSAQDFDTHLDDLRSISSAQEQLGQIQAAVYRTVMLSSSLDEAAIQAQRKQIQQQVNGVKRVTQAMDNSGSADVSGLLEKYGAQADQSIDLATVDINTAAAAMQTADDIYKQLSQSMTSQVDATQQASQKAMSEAAAAARLRSWVLMLVGLGATVGVLLFCARMLRAVAQSLREATDLSQAVAEGDLSTQVSTTRNDEIGQLLQALGRMVSRLNSSMETVREVADSIANAGSEIASGNQDLSHRTEQAAGNLQQTASSMQQLTETVHHSADAANQATHLASTASSVALRGGEAVAQVVLTMDQINQASRKIGDIIGIIDGIAFQTNILALNAAVEAARAGEQGRGFAVVASEVRSLAGRSAEAAREIKSLVTASVERVDGGSQQVQAAGATMAEIVASVQSVSDIITRISTSAAEQSQGIGEINGAIGQLDQMTQQNAALVEQSAASSEHLKTQARALTSLVAEFRLRAPSSAA